MFRPRLYADGLAVAACGVCASGNRDEQAREGLQGEVECSGPFCRHGGSVDNGVKIGKMFPIMRAAAPPNRLRRPSQDGKIS